MIRQLRSKVALHGKRVTLSLMMEEKLLRLKQVIERTSLSKSEIYRRVQDGKFPKQERRSHRYAVWKGSEIEAWMTNGSDGPTAGRAG